MSLGHIRFLMSLDYKNIEDYPADSIVGWTIKTGGRIIMHVKTLEGEIDYFDTHAKSFRKYLGLPEEIV